MPLLEQRYGFEPLSWPLESLTIAVARAEKAMVAKPDHNLRGFLAHPPGDGRVIQKAPDQVVLTAPQA